MSAKPLPIPLLAMLGTLLALPSCGGGGGQALPAATEGSIEATALRQSPPPPPGGKRFRRVAASDSGLSFRNELRPENRYTYLTNGAGLAVGDYDNDGLLDVYLISQDGPNKLFRQQQPLRFVDATAAAGGLGGGEAWGTGACFADIDGDGDLDLYVCNMEAKNLLYENQGDGTFVESAAKHGLDIAAASTMCAFADFDRDGRLDLYLVTNRALHAGWTRTPEVLQNMRPPADTLRAVTEMVPNAEQWRRIDKLASDGLLKSNRDVPEDLREHFLTFRGRRYPAGQQDRLFRNVAGTFVDVTQSAGIQDQGNGLSATWFDYDDDGYPDLYVANDLESPDVLYHNERNGRFRNVTRDVVPHTAYYGMGSDFGDVDGDGRLDLMVADMSMTTHEKAKVLMGDMDEERPILMHHEPPQAMRNALLLNTGLGRFQEAAKLAGVASTDWTWSLRFGDLDLDGRLDLFCTNGIARFDTDPDLKLAVESLWREGRQQAAIERIQNVPRVPERNIAMRNVDDLRFENVSSNWGLDLEAVSHGAVVADFDGDGDLDILVNNFEEPAALYENQSAAMAGGGGRANALVVRLRGVHSDRFGTGARVVAQLANGKRLVREISLSRGYLSGHPAEAHFGLGPEATVDLSVQWPSGHVQQFEQLAAGQRYTVTEPGRKPPNIWTPREGSIQPATFVTSPAPPFQHRENTFDEYEQQPLLPAEVSRLGPALCASGRQLFVGGARGQAGALFVADGSGWHRVEGPWERDAACEDVGACFVDYDGDGDDDLVVTSGGAETPAGDETLRDRVYRNQGEAGFVVDREALPGDVRESSGRAVAADYDGDGDQDLFVAGRLVPGSYPDAPSSRLYQNDGNGRFRDATAELAPTLADAGMVTSALWTDADGDGSVDLLLPAHWQPVRLLRNDDERLVDHTEKAGVAAT
ncbi:MAG: VCBS repeat-containing protein, partial [Planctomycetota bacterium]